MFRLSYFGGILESLIRRHWLLNCTSLLSRDHNHDFIVLTYHRELHLPLCYLPVVMKARVVASIFDGDISDADGEF